ncbi:MAG: S1 RNA-binding domain-containing protein [Alphaproteobacteria bacterium]|nr:S1 RNA-binding domain-containing protein [Alphaproteobacteria bacterium]
MIFEFLKTKIQGTTQEVEDTPMMDTPVTKQDEAYSPQIKKDFSSISVGDTIEAPVTVVLPSAVYVDLSPRGTGIIHGREFLIAKDVLRKIHPGDSIVAKIISLESIVGNYIDLSLKEARTARIWAEAEDAMKQGTTFEVTVLQANRGGCVAEWNGLRVFIPASHLREDHYPKVGHADKDAIQLELKKLIGEKLSTVITSVNIAESKIIMSERKGKEQGPLGESTGPVTSLPIGTIVEGTITGIVDFGVFVKVNPSVEGLVHISEINWGLVDNPNNFCKMGDVVSVKVVGNDNGKYSFSMKALQKNPWDAAKDKYKPGQEVSGVVFKFSPHGAFAAIEVGISGLVHISNFTDEKDMHSKLSIGKSHLFTISNFEPKEQKLTLILRQ